MLEFLVEQFIPELLVVEAKVKKFLGKYKYLCRHANIFQIDVEERLWLSVVCLASAKTAKGLNRESVQVASYLQLFNLATQLHMTLPKYTQQKTQQEIKYPVLLGDLLYSSIFNDICNNDLQEYLFDFIVLLEYVHEEAILRACPFKDDISYIHTDINLCGEMTQYASFLGARTVQCSGEILDLLKDLGYLLGVLKEVWNTNVVHTPYLNCWYQAWHKVELLSHNCDQSLFENLLLEMGKKWALKKPVMLKEIRA